ncbi:MAG: hypothetical protein EOO39_02505 [Cytophagaceae bacterium]|nr:MAG: hypothetical protein EOO39_02505 [Cytophagaceae bacterium]
MEALKNITYYLHPDDEQPRPGQFLVTISRSRNRRPQTYDGVLSVMLIKTVRKIRHKRIINSQGYALELHDKPEFKPLTVVERLSDGVQVWVRGEESLPCFWLPRGKPT